MNPGAAAAGGPEHQGIGGGGQAKSWQCQALKAPPPAGAGILGDGCYGGVVSALVEIFECCSVWLGVLLASRIAGVERSLTWLGEVLASVTALSVGAPPRGAIWWREVGVKSLRRAGFFFAVLLLAGVLLAGHEFEVGSRAQELRGSTELDEAILTCPVIEPGRERASVGCLLEAARAARSSRRRRTRRKAAAVADSAVTG